MAEGGTEDDLAYLAENNICSILYIVPYSFTIHVSNMTTCCYTNINNKYNIKANDCI